MATTDKYDRQLRLWGSHGQRALMNSHLLLLGADAVGTETLKNLVLPGIGNFTVCDGQKVTQSDLGVNFFVRPSDLDKSRAEAVCENLCEMNEDVKGYAIAQPPASLVDQPDILHQYSMIIAANQPSNVVVALSKFCWEKSIPLMLVRSYGFLGYIRLQLRNHDIIEGKPEVANGKIPDIRINKPFLDLERFAASISLDDLSPHDHKHVPYVIILIQVLQSWKTDHGGTAPSRKDKKELIAMVEDLSNNYVPTSFPDETAKEEWECNRGMKNEENFQEAVSVANICKLWAGKNIRSELLQLLETETSTNGNEIENESGNGSANDSGNNHGSKDGSPAKQTHFGVMLRALKLFLSMNNGVMPHSGELPDMISSTKYYVELRKVYENKAKDDKKQMRSITNELCKEAGINNIEDENLDLFCKNVYDINRLTFRTIVQETECSNIEEIKNSLFTPYETEVEQTPIIWYLVLKAADQFYTDHGRYPGQIFGDSVDCNPMLQQDIDYVWNFLKAQVVELGIQETLASILPGDNMLLSHAQELVRYGGTEMHNISAIIGGIGAQEAVKIATHQYMPMDNSYIYNGIACVGLRFEG